MQIRRFPAAAQAVAVSSTRPPGVDACKPSGVNAQVCSLYAGFSSGSGAVAGGSGDARGAGPSVSAGGGLAADRARGAFARPAGGGDAGRPAPFGGSSVGVSRYAGGAHTELRPARCIGPAVTCAPTGASQPRMPLLVADAVGVHPLLPPLHG